MGSRRKWLVQIIFLVLVMGATAYGLFQGSELKNLLKTLQGADMRYGIAGLGCVVAFILLESVILHFIMASLGQRNHLSHCCLYSFVGFFFSCITPSAGGGQPAQVYFMHRDDIPAAVSIPVLMLVTITYKLVLVIYGFGVLLLRPVNIMAALEPLMWWFYLGMGSNVLFVGAYIGLLLWPGGMEMAVRWCLARLPVKEKRKAAWIGKLEKAMKDYRMAAGYLRQHPGMGMNVLLITFVQRTVLFFVTYLAIRCLHLRGDWLEVVVLQAVIALGTDLLPLPGGMGANETMFLGLFGGILAENQILPVLLVSRGISYYCQLILSSIFTVVAALTIGKRKKT